MSEPAKRYYKTFSDNMHLQAENARLKAEVERLTQLNSTLALRYDATNSMLDGCAKEIEEMEAEVERLTKAGDEVIREWSSGDETEARNFMKALAIWNAAKEGRKS